MSLMTQNMQPTMRRSIPLCMRNDLKMSSMQFRGRPYWTVKDPVSLRYHRLREEQYLLLTLLDGKRTLEELQRILQQKFPYAHWGLTDLQSLVSDLHEKRLVVSQRRGQAEGINRQRQKTQRQKLFSATMSLLFLRLPGVYPEPFLRRGYPWIRWIFHPLAILTVIGIVVSAMGLLAINFHVAMRQMPEFQQFFGWPNLLYLSMTIAVVKVFHELGHGFTCHHCGAESHSIGVMLLVFSPTLYCDVTDSWMLPGKWQRIAIAAAGIYVEVFLSAIALFCWWYTEPGLLHHLALNVFFVTSVSTVIINMNPLMRFDGYYLLSDFLEIPNLQQRSSQAVLNWIGWNCFGIEPRPDPFEPERGKAWLMSFAAGSGIYRGFVMVGIGIFLYTVLKPYRLQNLGVMLSVFSISMMVGQFLYRVVTMVRVPRSKQLSRKRMAVSALVVATVVLAVSQIPVPLYIQAAVMIQPHDVKHIYTKTAGTLREIRVQSGDQVRQDQVLATLTSPELDDRLRELEVEIAVQRQRRRNAVIQRDPAQKQLAENALASRLDQQREALQQHERLILKSPVSGAIVSAEVQPKEQKPSDDHSLEQWYGNPLETHNLGALLLPNTHLCSIAPNDRLEAVLFIDQSDRNDLQPGHPVRIKFDHLPNQVYEGDVTDLSAQAVAYVPSILSNKTGGPLPTVTEEGRERLTGVAWKARVILNRDSGLFVSGLRGRARVVISSRSLGSWLYRWIRKTVHFRL
ncbi:MAG: efflux RND transporter periplasmic adaptor subunit [Fuerstiella sp.]|nr:efflux RND transporter periplasmic adaptor subunit [Fuerstiella sp.]